MSDRALEVLRAALVKVAPDVDLGSIPRDADLRDEAELDSIDFLNLVTTICDNTGIDIPERDYPRLATVDGVVDYLVSRLA